MNIAAKGEEIKPIFYQLPTADIVVLKSILETYEFIGELRTLDANAGLVVVLALESSEALVRQVISSEPNLASLRELEESAILAQSQYSGDWLIKEIYTQSQ